MIKQDHGILEQLINERRKKAFMWPFELSAEPVQPVEAKPEQPQEAGGLPPVPPMPDMNAPVPPMPKTSSGSDKNVADRMLAEGLDLPEQAGSKPKLEGDPVTSGAMGGQQSRLLAKRKNDNMNKPSSLGGL